MLVLSNQPIAVAMDNRSPAQIKMRYTGIIALLTSVSCCNVELLYANKTHAELVDTYGIAYEVRIGAIHGVYHSPGHVMCETAGAGFSCTGLPKYSDKYYINDTPENRVLVLFNSTACALTRSRFNDCVDVGMFRGTRYYMPMDPLPSSRQLGTTRGQT